MTDCPHGMPSPASCFDCMIDGNYDAPRDEPERADSRPFTARKDGWCPVCHEGVTAGMDQLVHTTQERYAHPSCVAPSTTPG